MTYEPSIYSSLPKPSAVGFDLGDTLYEYAGVPLDWEREYPAALASVAAQSGLPLTSERLESGTRALLRYNTRRTPRPDEREFAADHIFRELLVEWGAPQDALVGCIAAFFEHFRQTLRAFPESVAVLAELQARGVPTGFLTDVPYGMPRELVLADFADTGLPILDERLITSTTVGHRKPHPAGFRTLARALGVSCERLLYVGNERKDVEGGNAAGCQTVLLWRSAGESPDWGQAFTVRSLEQIHPLMALHPTIHGLTPAFGPAD
jgi:putative hydrolase of the HAD superfamily